MNKKLKIQFWKAEKALAMQILEQEGLPSYKEYGGVLIWDNPALCENSIDLRGRAEWDNLHIPHIEFDTNAKRDAYLKRAVNAITKEMFTGKGELKVGEMCEISEDRQHWAIRRLLAILPKKYEMRYITTGNGLTDHFSWRYARPITKRTEPTVEECGNVITYTWCDKISENN